MGLIDQNLKTFNCAQRDEDLFFVSSEMNLVFKYSMKNKDVVFLPSNTEDLLGKSLYGNVIAVESDVYIIPFCAKKMWKYNERTGWTSIDLPPIDYSCKFMGAIRHGQYIYLLGYEKPEIYKYDCLLKTFNKLNIDSDLKVDEELGCFGLDYEVRNGIIFIPYMSDNKVMEINCNDSRIKVVDVPSSSRGYSGIACCEDGFWLSPRKGKHYINYSYDGEIKEYELPKEYEPEFEYFGGAYCKGREIIFTSFNKLNYEFDSKNPQVGKTFGPGISYYKVLDSGYIIFSEIDGTVHCETEKGITSIIEIQVPVAKKMEYIKVNMDKKKVLSEGRDMELADFIEMIKL